MNFDPTPIADATLAWVRHAVIGLGLCPFAGGPVAAGRVRIQVTPVTEIGALLDVLADELRHLATADPAALETTLLVHPRVLTDFLDFNDALDLVDAQVGALGLTGVIQVASFHPDYRFAGTAADDIGNATNRSPYPTLHLLRESSIERAVAAWGDTDAIYQENVKRLEALGAAGWEALSRHWRG